MILGGVSDMARVIFHIATQLEQSTQPLLDILQRRLLSWFLHIEIRTPDSSLFRKPTARPDIPDPPPTPLAALARRAPLRRSPAPRPRLIGAAQPAGHRWGEGKNSSINDPTPVSTTQLGSSRGQRAARVNT
jgi:hypothetical protein